MRVRIISVAAKVPAWVTSGYEDYAKRLSTALPLEVRNIKPADRTRGDAERWRAEEWQRLAAATPPGAIRVALDMRGALWSTEELAQRLNAWRHDYADAAFLVGGPDGLAPDAVSGADALWSLSRLTLPHALVRIILAEQFYRAWSLLQGHPYHRA